MVLLEMRAVGQVMDQNRMLKEAGILGAGWLVLGFETMAKGIAAVRRQEEDAIEAQAHAWKRDSLVGWCSAALLLARVAGKGANARPGQPPHSDLHVWVWQANPSGMFAPSNPNVNCQ